MLLTAAGKQASLTIIQYILAIYWLHNFNLDVRNTLIPAIQKGVIQEKQTNVMILHFDITEWYSRGRHIDDLVEMVGGTRCMSVYMFIYIYMCIYVCISMYMYLYVYIIDI